MQLPPTIRLYLDDDHCFEAEASVVAVRETAIAFDRTCFYPGGGGQPPDDGTVRLRSGERLDIPSVAADADDIIWHTSVSPTSPDIVGQSATLILNRERRRALTRYHTVLHVLNTIALRDYGGWITGVQIGVDYFTHRLQAGAVLRRAARRVGGEGQCRPRRESCPARL